MDRGGRCAKDREGGPVIPQILCKAESLLDQPVFTTRNVKEYSSGGRR